MNWKKYRDYFQKNKIDESHFVIGLDIGAAASSVAFFNPLTLSPEIIDMSGGYGRPNSPTALQFVHETNEWIFGEYAISGANVGADTFFYDAVHRLGNKDYTEIAGKLESIPQILSYYIRDLISNCKNINPKAEIAGVCVSVPSYMSEEAKAELETALKAAGLENAFIGFFTDRECVFVRYYFHKEVKRENVLLLDFGAREIRGGLYAVNPLQNGAQIDCLSSIFDDQNGTNVIDNALFNFFSDCFKEQNSLRTVNEQHESNLRAFTYQHKDLIFQKNKQKKPIKLYYNFAYPPFQKQISAEETEQFILPFSRRFSKFLTDVLKKAQSVNRDDVDTVICAGGGFEMPWAKDAVAKMFPSSRVVFCKNAKGINAEGASIIAAQKLSVIDKLDVEIEDKHQIKKDLGIMVNYDGRERFYPLFERNAFWWQTRPPKKFIVNESTDKPVYIELFTRDEQGAVQPVKRMVLDGLPTRPAGTTRVNMALEFSGATCLTACVTDAGFGELYPVSNYSRKFEIKI